MATSFGLAWILCFALAASAASATQFRVGDDKGWSVPAAGAEPLNAWAGRMRFQIGDQLLFVYPKETDSVLLVDQAAYNACNTTTYITKFEGGSTVFTLDRSGPFFFISGNQASCTANQKLIVVVLAADHTPPGLSPIPPAMPPTSAAPEPSPSSPPSPPSMAPPSGAPMPSPMSPPSMAPPSGAPMPSPMSPPSMAPPSGAPMPSPMSPPSMAPPSGAPMPPPSGAPMPTPESAPAPTGSAPGAAPAAAPGSSPSSPGTPGTPGSPGTPGGAPQPPSDSNTPPGEGPNSTTPGSGAAQVTAGLISTLAAGFSYAMLAV